MMIFVGDRFVVTVRKGEANPLAGVRARLEHTPGAAGPRPDRGHVLGDGLDRGQLHRDRPRAERGPRRDRAYACSPVRSRWTPHRSTCSSARCSRPSAPRCRWRRRWSGWRRDEPLPFVHEKARPFFSDISDHLLRVIDHVESYDRLLTDVLSAHLAQISVQQNDDMRRISAWVAIAAVPTMIAGIYGMNFTQHPRAPGQHRRRRARVLLRLLRRPGGDGRGLRVAVPRVPALRLAVRLSPRRTAAAGPAPSGTTR